MCTHLGLAVEGTLLRRAFSENTGSEVHCALLLKFDNGGARFPKYESPAALKAKNPIIYTPKKDALDPVLIG